MIKLDAAARISLSKMSKPEKLKFYNDKLNWKKTQLIKLSKETAPVTYKLIQQQINNIKDRLTKLRQPKKV